MSRTDIIGQNGNDGEHYAMRVKRIGEHDLPKPQIHSAGAAGFDLRAERDVTIGAGGLALIPTGFAWEIPAGYVGIIKDRSSMATKRDLSVRAGVIDSDYRGEIHVALRNEGEHGVGITEGTRIAQLVIVRLCPITATMEVESLDDTERGDGGFGSTGNY